MITVKTRPRIASGAPTLHEQRVADDRHAVADPASTKQGSENHTFGATAAAPIPTASRRMLTGVDGADRTPLHPRACPKLPTASPSPMQPKMRARSRSHRHQTCPWQGTPAPSASKATAPRTIVQTISTVSRGRVCEHPREPVLEVAQVTTAHASAPLQLALPECACRSSAETRNDAPLSQ